MSKNIVEKILSSHLIKGDLSKNEQITIKVDHTMWSDGSGIVASQLLESVGAKSVKPELNVLYADHSAVQISSEFTDDAMFMRTACARYGMIFSKHGNGIMHSLHCQRFAVPGKVLAGADSHSVTSGALGMLAMGEGAISVGKALITGELNLNRPKVMSICLSGELSPGVSAKDIALEIMRVVRAKGGTGYALEYTGEAVPRLNIPQRITLSNMSIEVGATAGVWPSDEVTRAYMKAQSREKDWIELKADPDAVYDKTIEIDLSALEPLVAINHHTDDVVKVTDIEGCQVRQVFIGSCNSGSYMEVAKVAKMLKGKKISKDCEFLVSCNTRQTMAHLVEDGVIKDLVDSGARILECACGPCIGNGQAPCSNSITVRTTNRNFRGRSGTWSAHIYMVSPEVAAATALTGVLTDPRKVFDAETLADVCEPETYKIVDDLFVFPEDVEDPASVQLYKGDHIADPPRKTPLRETIDAAVGIKLGDEINTDDINPNGPYNLRWFGNVPKLSFWTFNNLDPEYVERAKKLGHSVIVGGVNYGQGSARETAAQLPSYLGVEIVLAKSIARIHKVNLVNYGIIPMIFDDPADFDKIDMYDKLVVENVYESLEDGKFVVRVPEKGIEFTASSELSDYDKMLIRLGGLLNYLQELVD